MSASFNLTIDSSDAAFETPEDARAEFVRILGEVAEHVERGRSGGSCRDFNGNKCGTWSAEHTADFADGDA